MPDQRIRVVPATGAARTRNRGRHAAADAAVRHHRHQHQQRKDERDARDRVGAEKADEIRLSDADQRLHRQHDEDRPREPDEARRDRAVQQLVAHDELPCLVERREMQHRENRHEIRRNQHERQERHRRGRDLARQPGGDRGAQCAEPDRDNEVEQPEPVPEAKRRARRETGRRMRDSTIHGAVTPIAMSPAPAAHAKKPGSIPYAYEREEHDSTRAPGLDCISKAKVGGSDEFMKRA